MRATQLAISIAILVAVIAGCWWYISAHPVTSTTSPLFGNLFLGSSATTTATDTAAQVPVTPLTKSYQNNTFHFSFNYPDGYTVHAVDDVTAGGTTVLMQDAKGNGIQIFISPDTDSDTSITPERIQQDIPDMTVTNAQPVNMTAGGGTGLAFESNNAAFGGASREVWFVFHGNLYQISTYLEYDALLKAILATWKFF